MLHTMKLQKSPFEKIVLGAKTIEIRLNDEKRQLIENGDSIRFLLADDNSQSITTQVINIHHFNSFKELFYFFEPITYGGKTRDEYIKMYNYYNNEDEEKYGVIGIEIKLLN